MPPRLARVLVVALSTAVGGSAVGCGWFGAADGSDGDSAAEASEEVVVPAVETAVVSRGVISDRLVTSAAVESIAQANLVPQTSGRVLSIEVEEGDAVRRGQVLAVLENVSVESGADRAEAEVARLERELAQLEPLLAQGAVSERELETVRDQLATARTTAREARFTEGQTRLTAPFAGVVARRDLRIGEVGGQGVAFQIVDPDRLRVVASLPERDLPRVAVGQTATLVSAYDADAKVFATVSRIAPVVDANTGTFRLTLDLPEGQRVLRPGQYVTVELEVERRDGVLVVPRSALTYEAGRPVLYRVVDAPEPAEGDTAAPDSPFVAERVLVELGLQEPTRVEVLSGLSEGDRLVVVGQATLDDGAPVKPVEPAEADTAATEG